jgi:hypothetical protein
MKKSFWTFLFLIAKLSEICVSQKVDETISAEASAIGQIVHNFYANKSERFDVIVFEENPPALSAIVNEVLKVIKRPIKYIRHKPEPQKPSKPSNKPTKPIEPPKIEIDQSAILFFNSIGSYEKFHKQIKLSNEYAKDLYFLVYIFGFTHGDMKFKTNELLMHEYFLVHVKNLNTLWLMTHLTFQEKYCRVLTPHRLNEFLKSSRRWNRKVFSIEKFNSFNGCEMVVETTWPQYPLLLADVDADRKMTRIYGD